MNEFSLLQHLNIVVPECTPNHCPPAREPGAPHYRVWAPVNRPPTKARSSEMRSPQRPQPRHSQYADPAGEVILGRENGQAVEYTIFNSKVPSIYGMNFLLAEGKRQEAAKREDQERLRDYRPVGLGHGDDENGEAARRRLLCELQECNRQQAERRRGEVQREAERRIRKEQALLKAVADNEKMREQRTAEAKRDAKLAFRQVAEEAANTKRARMAKTEGDGQLSFGTLFFPPEKESCTGERDRRIAEVNRQLSEKVKAERQEQRQRSIESARARFAWEAEQERLMEVHSQREKKRLHSYFEELAEMANEAKSRAQVQREQERNFTAVPLIAAREEEAGAKVIRLQHDLQINRRLTEEKHERQRLERDRDRKAAAILYQSKASSHGDAKDRRNKFYESLRREAEARRTRLLAEADRERIAQKALLEDAEKAEHLDVVRAQEKLRRQQMHLRASLDKQLAMKERGRRSRSSNSLFPTSPALKKDLYRCPVTGQLLRATAFGISSRH